MLKVLLKKQFTEIFKGYFYNSKDGKARSKTSTVLWFLLFLIITVCCIGGMFYGLAKVTCEGLCLANAEWLYFAIFGLVSLTLGVIGSIFSTYSVLYLAKDNDLLLSLPIPAKTIVFSRIVTVYLSGLAFCAISFLPSVIVYTVTKGPDVKIIIGGLIMLLDISLLCLVLSCLLGLFIAKLRVKIKNKSLMTVALSVLFVAAYYFFYFKFQELITDILNNAAFYAASIKGKAYLVYLFGSVASGETEIVLGSIIISAVTVALVMYLIAHSFFQTVTVSPALKASKKAKNERVKTVKCALLIKEFKRLAASPVYMLNSALGVLVLPLMGIVLLVMGGQVREIIEILIPSGKPLFTVAVLTVVYVSAPFINTVTPAVSLEGKNIWIPKSLPVPAFDVFMAKIKVQQILALTCVTVFLTGAFIGLKLSASECFVLLISSYIYLIMMSFFGNFVGIVNANLSWTNEVQPVKQSVGVLITLFVPMIAAAVLLGGYLILPFDLNATVYIGIFTLLNIIVTAVLYNRLRKNAETRLLEL